MDRLKKLISNGPVKHPGAKCAEALEKPRCFSWLLIDVRFDFGLIFLVLHGFLHDVHDFLLDFCLIEQY